MRESMPATPLKQQNKESKGYQERDRNRAKLATQERCRAEAFKLFQCERSAAETAQD